jgi:hypothetical protein
MLNIGTILGGAFGLVKRRPIAVAVWGALYFIGLLGFMIVMQPMFQAQAAMAGGADPAAAMAAMPAMLGRLLLVELGIFILFIILFTATQRAVLRPEQAGFAYIRLGMDELRMLGLSLLLLIIFYAVTLVVGILVGLVMGLALSGGGSGGGAAAAVLLTILFTCAILVFGIWFQVRVSLMFPLILIRGQIALGEGWRLSRGRFWTLFGAYLIIILLLFVLWSAVASVTMGPYFAELMQSGGKPEAVQAAAQHQMMRQFGSFNASAILGWVLMAITGGLGLALYGGATATAAHELTIDREGVARTFA